MDLQVFYFGRGMVSTVELSGEVKVRLYGMLGMME
jgi:hypothetical protein